MPSSRGCSKRNLKTRLRRRANKAAASDALRASSFRYLELIDDALQAAGLSATYQTAAESPTGAERVVIAPAPAVDQAAGQ